MMCMGEEPINAMPRNTTGSDNHGHSWDTNGIRTANNNVLGAGTGTDAARPKGRIRRSMTACNTCRKLKTRCDLDPRNHACRRCLSLRLDCKLPESPDRSQENLLIRAEAMEAIPSIEERLTSLERSMGEMTRLMREMIDRSPSTSYSSASQSTQSINLDEASSEGSTISHFLPKPAHLIQELQSEFFGEADAPNTQLPGDLVTKGIVDSRLSMKLMQLFVEQFGSWISINDSSDLQNDPLLFNTACLLASRYVPGIPSSTIYAMYLQVRHAAVNILWNPPPVSYSSLQALTLLCLWSAKTQKEPPIDSWLLSGISINHGIISFDFLNSAPAEHVVDSGMVKKLRLWNALCLTQLHSAIGNARPFNLQQKYLEYCPRILEHPSATFDDRRVVAEIQLYHITLRIQIDSQQMQLPEPEYEELEGWKMAWAHLLTNDQHSTLNLNLNFWFCQLLLHRTASVHSDSDRLASDILDKSRLIVSNFIQSPFSTAIGAIDQLYFIVGYAALTICDFNLMDPLIDKLQSFLMHLSPNEDHIAYRFSCVIAEFKRRYHTRSGAGARAGTSGPFVVVKRPSFAEGVEHEFIPSLLESVPDSYPSMDQFVPAFLPAYSLAGAVFQNVPMDVGIPGQLVQDQPNG